MNETKNLILRNLSADVRRRILLSAEAVHLDLREEVISPGIKIEYVDFPDSGVVSLLTPMEDGSLIEITSVGREGLIGVPVILGVNKISEVAFCQVPGMNWRVPAGLFRKFMREHSELETICHRYIVMLYNQVSINTGCNRTHSTEQRFARWLLLTRDRSDSDELSLTQEFLAYMLAVSRTGVNASATKLQDAGLITYVRGKIRILNRPGLEKVSCPCYRRMTEAAASVFTTANSV